VDFKPTQNQIKTPPVDHCTPLIKIFKKKQNNLPLIPKIKRKLFKFSTRVISFHLFFNKLKNCFFWLLNFGNFCWNPFNFLGKQYYYYFCLSFQLSFYFSFSFRLLVVLIWIFHNELNGENGNDGLRILNDNLFGEKTT
jgi:hypothetical protein